MWTFTDLRPLGPGQIGLGALHRRNEEALPGIVDATFDDIYFTPIPEPSAFILAKVVIRNLTDAWKKIDEHEQRMKAIEDRLSELEEG